MCALSPCVIYQAELQSKTASKQLFIYQGLSLVLEKLIASMPHYKHMSKQSSPSYPKESQASVGGEFSSDSAPKDRVKGPNSYNLIYNL